MKDKKAYFKGLFVPLGADANNSFDVYGFDVETYHVKSDFKRISGKKVECWKQEFLMGSVYGKTGVEVFWDKEEMKEHLLSRKYRGSQIFATNLEFDFNQLYSKDLHKFHLVYSAGLIAAIYSEKKNDKNRKWIFTDTSNFMRVSLSKLGDLVGVPKMKAPSTMIKSDDGLDIVAVKPKTEKERKEIEDYNINDSKITYLFAEKLRNFCTTHNMKLKLTVGSTGMDYWRRNHQEHVMKREPAEMVMKHFQGSFRGGMTQVFKRGGYDGNMWYYDYRSSYPSVMVDGVDGKGNYPDPSTQMHTMNSNTDFIDMYEGICHAKVKAPYDYMPYLSVKSNMGKLLFPYGTYDGWFTNFELRKAMNLGYEVTPGEMIYYVSTMKPFRNAVKYLYKLRKKYKKEGHQYEALVKIIMNSGLFGKWGTNPNNMEEIVSLKNVTFKEDGCYFKGKKMLDFNVNEVDDMFEGFVTMKKAVKPFKYSFPIWSEYTTALGRNKLIQDIKKHPRHIVYCDTDSAVCTKPVFEEGNNLGDWELEHKLKGGVFIKPKLYMLKKDEGYVCKSKGVGKFMSTKEQFENALYTGKVSMSRFTKMKESNNIGIKSGSVIRLDKHLSFEDTKRDWLGKSFNVHDWCDSEPLELREGFTKEEQLKALYTYQKEQSKIKNKFLQSDLFDKHSVGSDITASEFLDNEIDFRE